jgi:hypothetical protein
LNASFDSISPSAFFGFEPGEERRLVDWPRMVAYFRALDVATDRLLLLELGTSIEGRPFICAFISSAENLSKLEELKAIQQRLADPRGASPEDLEQSIVRGKTIVLVTCGVHPAEVGSAQTAPKLAYDLISRSDEEAARIRDEVITILVPAVNPDGLDLICDWYGKTLDTTAEGTWPPTLTQKYAGGENNRDWYMLTQPEQRLVVEKVHCVWRPHIVIDHHQMEEDSFRYFIPPYAEPSNPQIDPVIQASTVEIGTAITSAFTARGQSGVVNGIFFAQYSPASAYAPYHGGVHILTEAASCKLATSMTIPWDRLKPMQGHDPKTRRGYHPLPWPGGEWRLKDIVAYNMTSTLTVLDNAARQRTKWLRNFLGVRARASAESKPFAFVIPADQRDAATAEDMVTILRRTGVEIEQTTFPFQAGGKHYPADSYVVRMTQPASAFAKALLEQYQYPVVVPEPGQPPKRPYDVVVNNLPLLMGVECDRIDSAFNIPTKATTETSGRERVRDGTRETLAFGCDTNGSALLVNKLLAANVEVGRLASSWHDGSRTWPAGSYVTSGRTDASGTIAAECRVDVSSVPLPPHEIVQPIRSPRIGVYRSWLTGFFACDEGWLRYVLDEHGFPFETLRNADLAAGGLHEKFDVIIVPQHLPGDLMYGQDPYAFAGATPHQRDRSLDDGSEDDVLGDYPREFAKGIGQGGMKGLLAFAKNGGTLVMIDTSSDAAIRYLHLPVKNALQHVSDKDFYNPGSIMRIIVDHTHPLGYGYERESTCLFVNGPAFDLGEDSTSVARYPLENQLVYGWMHGSEAIAGKSALACVPLEQGHVVLFGFRPHFRAQMRVTYRFLFNAIYFSCLQGRDGNLPHI